MERRLKTHRKEKASWRRHSQEPLKPKGRQAAACLIIIANLGLPVVRSVFHVAAYAASPAAGAPGDAWSEDLLLRTALALSFLLLVSPLFAVKHIGSLSWTSWLAVGAVAGVGVLVASRVGDNIAPTLKPVGPGSDDPWSIFLATRVRPGQSRSQSTGGRD